VTTSPFRVTSRWSLRTPFRVSLFRFNCPVSVAVDAVRPDQVNQAVAFDDDPGRHPQPRESEIRRTSRGGPR
jgi:hypothetical protein